MKLLGLDIGTTTISAVIMENGKVLTSLTKKNDAFITGRPAWEKSQNPARILELALSCVSQLLAQHPDTARIGVTGQQHGIVYLDKSGHAVSCLYTWQDGRGELYYDDESSYASHLSQLTGMPLATGFGMVTHYYNMKNGLVPAAAATFCTIHDYVAMTLAGRPAPSVEPSDAASFGLYDLQKKCFDEKAVALAGIAPELLPPIAKTPLLGIGSCGLPVYAAIGDNQASFLGATGGASNCALVNVGTGSQFSIHTDKYAVCPGLETRPFPKGGYLLVGSTLCGGRAYALLEELFRQCAQMVCNQPVKACYDAMTRLLKDNPPPADYPSILPLFQGTRADPSIRGSIEGIGTENFTPLHLIYGMMHGMAQELYGMYDRYRQTGGRCKALFGSGNGLRKNPYLCEIFRTRFGMPLTLSGNDEEAACGAALYAACQP